MLYYIHPTLCLSYTQSQPHRNEPPGVLNDPLAYHSLAKILLRCKRFASKFPRGIDTLPAIALRGHRR